MLFCGGLGLRLRGGSEAVPKPMVTIGGRPILWHVMKYYAHYGHRDFIVCLGYHGDVIRRFFSEEEGLSGCRVTYVDTGIDTNVGQRLRAVRSYVEGEPVFLANYSDGLTDLDLPATWIASAGRTRSRACSARGRPARFHVVSEGCPRVRERCPSARRRRPVDQWGLLRLHTRHLRLHRGGRGPRGGAVPAPHPRAATHRLSLKGFWACMDTFKDKQFLEAMYHHGLAPWEVWRRPAPAAPTGSRRPQVP